jgi:hypothetical protein
MDEKWVVNIEAIIFCLRIGAYGNWVLFALVNFIFSEKECDQQTLYKERPLPKMKSIDPSM